MEKGGGNFLYIYSDLLLDFFFIDQVFNPSLHLTHTHDTFRYSSLSNSAWLTFPARSISEKSLNSLFYLSDSIFGVAHNAL